MTENERHRLMTVQKVYGWIFVVLTINFVVWAISSAILGGEALDGKILDGRFFLHARSGYTEVSAATFAFSRNYAVVTVALGPLCLLAVTISKQIAVQLANSVGGLAHNPIVEFLRDGYAGAATALVFFGALPAGVALWEHVLVGGFLTGIFGAIIKSPPGGCLKIGVAFLVDILGVKASTMLIFASEPTAVPLGSSAMYMVRLLAHQLWLWGLLELAVVNYQMNKYPSIREKFEAFQRQGRES